MPRVEWYVEGQLNDVRWRNQQSCGITIDCLLISAHLLKIFIQTTVQESYKDLLQLCFIARCRFDDEAIGTGAQKRTLYIVVG